MIVTFVWAETASFSRTNVFIKFSRRKELIASCTKDVSNLRNFHSLKRVFNLDMALRNHIYQQRNVVNRVKKTAKL